MKVLLQFFACFALASSIWAQAPAPSVAKALKPEAYVLLVEPKVMRSANSGPLGNSQRTVFTPAKEVGGDERFTAYNSDAFGKLGISFESFVDRARAAADRRLVTLKPELIKDKDGRIAYAVYRGKEPIYSTLLVAPSIAKIFEKVFGTEVWLAAPDRNALYVFPAKPEVVDAFAGDLEQRFQNDAFSASEEIFSLNTAGELKAVAVFTDR